MEKEFVKKHFKKFLNNIILLINVRVEFQLRNIFMSDSFTL